MLNYTTHINESINILILNILTQYEKSSPIFDIWLDTILKIYISGF